jgi:RimJ/RimL family protein N-acetyltransferase
MCADEVDAVTLRTARLTLEPLSPAHADEMAPLLGDARLYAFTGGAPPRLEELRARYVRQAAGRSPDGVERWCNWIARRREDGVAVGFVQATVSEDPPSPVPLTAVLAWALGARFHGCGYAREAAAEMMRWLARTGVTRFAAYIHPEHTASMGVARALGMMPTDELVDGEVVWARRADAGSAADLRGSE